MIISSNIYTVKRQQWLFVVGLRNAGWGAASRGPRREDAGEGGRSLPGARCWAGLLPWAIARDLNSKKLKYFRETNEPSVIVPAARQILEELNTVREIALC